MDGDGIMCAVCGFTNCPLRCPNYTPKLICYCDNCGTGIYDTDELWKDCDNNHFCSESCAEDYYEIQEVNE